MHLLESYSLMSSSKIKKPFLLKKFFPLGVDKYITIHPNSKYPSKCYDLWQDCLDELKPILDKLGIAIVQIGSKEDKPLKGCYITNGQTNIGQIAYIISNSILHLGADSFPTHVASGLNKKIVCLYSNNFINCVKPFWSKEEDCILLEPSSRKNGIKPNFSAQEIPKTINEIKPEDIVKSVCKLLDIPYGNNKKTFYIGENYYNKFLELIPDHVVDIAQFNVESIAIRMDKIFDESILNEQLKISKATIITDRPINKNILSARRNNIKDIIFYVNQQGYVDFVEEVNKLNINMFIITSLKGEALNELKLEYLDYGNINIRNSFEDDILKIKNLNGTKYFKSSKLTLSKGKIYPSFSCYLKDLSINSFDCPDIEIQDTQEFWEEIEYFKISVDS